jgi:drug/metabolite transporter (DMT)-like permease
MDFSAILLLLITNFIGGSSFVATAYALKGFPTFAVVFWRMFLTSLLFLPFSNRIFKKTLTLNDWLRMAAVGIFGYVAPLLVGAAGQNLSDATHASLLMSVEPAAMIFLSAAFLGEGLTTLKVIALVLSVLGSCLIVFPDMASLSHSSAGDLLLGLQGFLFALYSVIGKPVLRKIDALSFTAITTFFGFLPMAFLASRFSIMPIVANARQAVMALAYLSAVVTFVGAITWNMALEKIPASQLANFIFLQPLIGVFFGVFALKETLTFWSIGGGLLILVGVYCAAKEPNTENAKRQKIAV